MPKTTKKQTKKAAAKRSAKAPGKSAVAEKRTKPRKPATPVQVDEPVAIYGVFPGTDENTSTACLGPVATPATIAEVKEEVGDVFAAAARVAGSLLAFGSLPLLAPMLIAGPVMSAIGMGASRLLDRPTAAAEPECAPATTAPVLVSVTCDNPQQDLDRRAYRDEKGQLHHHTRTYLRDHVNA